MFVNEKPIVNQRIIKMIFLWIFYGLYWNMKMKKKKYRENGK